MQNMWSPVPQAMKSTEVSQKIQEIADANELAEEHNTNVIVSCRILCQLSQQQRKIIQQKMLDMSWHE